MRFILLVCFGLVLSPSVMGFENMPKDMFKKGKEMVRFLESVTMASQPFGQCDSLTVSIEKVNSNSGTFKHYLVETIDFKIKNMG